MSVCTRAAGWIESFGSPFIRLYRSSISFQKPAAFCVRPQRNNEGGVTECTCAIQSVVVEVTARRGRRFIPQVLLHHVEVQHKVQLGTIKLRNSQLRHQVFEHVACLVLLFKTVEFTKPDKQTTSHNAPVKKHRLKMRLKRSKKRVTKAGHRGVPTLTSSPLEFPYGLRVSSL